MRRNGFHIMPLPRELRDQLLSGYLDDALSPDERARVDQLLQSDVESVKELEQLRELQLALRAVAAADSAIKLDQGFSDRVLGAAVARAHAEGLGDDHPLIRLAEQPSTSKNRSGPSRSNTGHDRKRASSLRIAGVLVGLAASIVVAVIALRPEPNQFAQTQLDPLSIAGLDNATAPDPDPIVNPVENPIAVPAADLIASGPPAIPNLTNPDFENPGSTDPGTPDPVIQPASTGSQMKQLEQPPAPAEAIAKSRNSVGPPAVDEIKIPEMNVGPIVILNVRRTKAGRNADPIGDALRYAKIEPASEKKITKEIVGFVKSTSGDAAEEASILYLQVPAKKFDEFYLRLVGDEVGIESIGLKLALDAPITKMVDAIRPDPTTVRHDEEVLQLFSDGGVVDEFSSQLGELDFLPVDRMKKKEGAIPASNGPDITAQILVLVK